MHLPKSREYFVLTVFSFLHIYIIWARRAGFSIWHKWKQVKVTSSGSVGEALSGRTSSGTFTDRTSPRCECMGTSSFTAWRTSCLYGVTYSRASPRLFPWYYLRLLHTDRTLSEVRVEWWLSCHRMAHWRAYTVLLTAEPLRGSFLGTIFVCYIQTAHSPRCEWSGGYPVTAWRTDVLIRCYLQPSLSEALPWRYLLQ